MAPPNQKNKGQALVEAVVGLPILVSAAGGLFFILWFSFSQRMIHHHAYEAGICLMNEQPRFRCENDLKKHIKRALPFVVVNRVQSGTRDKNAWVQVHYQAFQNTIFKFSTKEFVEVHL